MKTLFNLQLWQGFCQFKNTQNQTATHKNVPLYYYYKNNKNINYEY